MSNSKGVSFKGGIGNRNKKLDKLARRLKHTKKQSKKEYDVDTDTNREGIAKYSGQEVIVSAELVFVNGKDPFAPSLLEHVYVDDEYVDHMWVKFSTEDRRKLKFCYRQCRILFTGIVYRYTKHNDRQVKVKYGIISPKLLKE